MSDDRILAGVVLHVAGPATANAQSPKLFFKRGTWRQPGAAERSREQTVFSVFDWQSWDNLVLCHGQL